MKETSSIKAPIASDLIYVGRQRFDILRIRAGHRTQESLAQAAGVAGGHLRMIAAGLIPKEPTRQKIAAALGVPTERVWRPRKKRAAAQLAEAAA